MVLPPSDQLVNALDLGLEPGKAVAVGEEPGDAEERIRLQDPTKGDGGSDAVARGSSHLRRS